MRLAALLAVLLLAGCGSSSPQMPASPTPTTPAAVTATPPPQLLPGQDWVLVDSTVQPIPATYPVTLRFDDGAVSGQAPVNRYAGQVTLGEGTIAISGITSTKMAGPPEAMTAEQAYFESLGEVSSWEVMDETLMLSNDSGQLVYAAPDSVAAFAASLVGLRVKQAKSQIAEQGYEVRVVSVDGDTRPVTMDFRPDRINLTIVDGVVTRATQG